MKPVLNGYKGLAIRGRCTVVEVHLCGHYRAVGAGAAGAALAAQIIVKYC